MAASQVLYWSPSQELMRCLQARAPARWCRRPPESVRGSEARVFDSVHFAADAFSQHMRDLFETLRSETVQAAQKRFCQAKLLGDRLAIRWLRAAHVELRL
jgi:hypothetical protein